MIIKSNEKKENSAVELVVEVSAAEFEAAIEKVYNKQKKNIQLPGFRKGKAPRKMVEKMYGAEVFYEDAINEVYPEAYEAAQKRSRQRKTIRKIISELNYSICLKTMPPLSNYSFSIQDIGKL